MMETKGGEAERVVSSDSCSALDLRVHVTVVPCIAWLVERLQVKRPWAKSWSAKIQPVLIVVG